MRLPQHCVNTMQKQTESNKSSTVWRTFERQVERSGSFAASVPPYADTERGSQSDGPALQNSPYADLHLASVEKLDRSRTRISNAGCSLAVPLGGLQALV